MYDEAHSLLFRYYAGRCRQPATNLAIDGAAIMTTINRTNWAASTSGRKTLVVVAMTTAVSMPPGVIARYAVSGHSVRVGATQDLLALNIDLASVMQAGRWKSTRMPMRYGEEALAARGAMARAAEAQDATMRAKCINDAALILRGLIQ
jgi:hypothetical protein